MTDYPIVNENALNEFGEVLGLEDAAELLRTFFADTAEKVALISSPGANRFVAKREASLIKSSAALIGFERLFRHAQELEASAETLGAIPLRRSVVALQRVYKETAGFVENTLLPSLAELP
jgi:hypothetical protein